MDSDERSRKLALMHQYGTLDPNKIDEIERQKEEDRLRRTHKKTPAPNKDHIIQTPEQLVGAFLTWSSENYNQEAEQIKKIINDKMKGFRTSGNPEIMQTANALLDEVFFKGYIEKMKTELTEAQKKVILPHPELNQRLAPSLEREAKIIQTNNIYKSTGEQLLNNKSTYLPVFALKTLKYVYEKLGNQTKAHEYQAKIDIIGVKTSSITPAISNIALAIRQAKVPNTNYHN